MGPIKVNFGGGNRQKAVVISPEKAVLKTIINIIGTIIIGAIAYYFMLPPINLKAMEFYIYIAVVCAGYGVMAVITSKAITRPEYMPYVTRRQLIGPGIILGVAIVIMLVGLVISSVVFRAKEYSELLPVEDGNFSQDIQEISDFSSVPRLDDASSAVLANKKLGELIDYVSQYDVDDLHQTQINYKNHPVRVVPLKYAGIIKWLANTKHGIPAYVIVNMTTQQTELVELENNIKYTTAEHFGKRLSRHLRFQYPTYMFDEPSFEIDENGQPYWICARIDMTIGLMGGDDVIGAVVCNAITGECEYYTIEDIRTKKELQWIDRVYTPTLIIKQYDYSGQFKNGFWNSLLAQKDVKVTTEGYNYLALNDDVYFYTGVTSVTSDQSIVGFVLVNQRTKESKFYKISGAKEIAAKDSAQGQVQQYEYTATFPILLNIEGQPTYFMTLKDKTELVKMYAMVNVSQYNIVKTGATLEECQANYIKALKTDLKLEIDENVNTENNEDDKPADKQISGKIVDIRTSVIGGESYYYIKLEGGSAYYKTSASKMESVVILNVGDEVTVTYTEDGKGSIINITDIK